MKINAKSGYWVVGLIGASFVATLTSTRLAGACAYLSVVGYAVLWVDSAAIVAHHTCYNPKTINIKFNSFSLPADSSAITSGYVAWNLAGPHAVFQTGNGMVTVQDTSNAGVSWDGITYWNGAIYGYGPCNHIDPTCYSCGTMTSAPIYLNSFYTAGYSSSTIQGVAAHELGHAVGLDHTGGCVVMTPATSTRQSCGITGPVTDDLNCVNALY